MISTEQLQNMNSLTAGPASVNSQTAPNRSSAGNYLLFASFRGCWCSFKYNYQI